MDKLQELKAEANGIYDRVRFKTDLDFEAMILSGRIARAIEVGNIAHELHLRKELGALNQKRLKLREAGRRLRELQAEIHRLEEFGPTEFLEDAKEAVNVRE